MIFKVRDLLVRHRTGVINALRAHLAEFGCVAAAERLLADDRGWAGWAPGAGARTLPRPARRDLHALGPARRTGSRDRGSERARTQLAKRLMTIPGIGPVIATAIQTLAPPIETFRRARLRRLDGAGTTPALDRRQAAAGQDLEDGSARPAPSADHRGQRGGSLGGKTWRADRLLARAHACQEASHADRRGSCQQDGADRLGVDGHGWRLSSSDADAQPPAFVRLSRMWAGRTRDMGERSMRRDRENQVSRSELRARVSVVDLILASPYGPAARTRPLREAEHTSAPDHCPLKSNSACSRGAFSNRGVQVKTVFRTSHSRSSFSSQST